MGTGSGSVKDQAMHLPDNQPQESHKDDRRARELFNYFQPGNPALLPTCIPKFGQPQIKASPNLVLTSLTQLAALKLGVQRAIISLIGRETLYVVAEATRSLKLGDNSVCDNDADRLWMGCSNGPLAGTLCEETITLHPTAEERHRFFIVEDLKEHPTYCKIPCVAGAPYFRYYAGTPLTTASGINIGSLYVIDPRPNLSLSELDKETLSDIGDAVMDYLETYRQSLESGRLEDLLTGLNSFVQGEDNIEPIDKSPSRTPRLSVMNRSRTSSPRAVQTERPESDNGHQITRTVKNKATSEDQSKLTLRPPLTPTHDQNPSTEQFNSSIRRLKRNNVSEFERAAQIMRESLDLGEDGGVVIFDTNATAGSDLDRDLKDPPDGLQLLAKVCAISTKHTNTVGPEDKPDSSPIAQMERRFLKRILRRFNKGAIWYFHQDGTVFSSDDDSSKSESEDDTPTPSQSPSMSQPRLQGVLREKDLRALRKCFPDATRIIFTPLWDSFKSQWFGGCFCWSSAETRIFSAHVELGGVLGFGSSLMMEHSRIKSQESDKKKADFISNISHELRSPLHGILAASEFLAEQISSESPRSLLDTICACSQTLLDTFEQILDFTKINSFQKKRRDHTTRLYGDGDIAKSHALPESLQILKVTNIVAVIEDVIESIVFGATHYKSGLFEDPTSVSIEHVDVSIDVAPGDWVYTLERGALRRIIMNVFSNALKYTKNGSVSVHIEVQTGTKGSGTGKVENFNTLVLTVSDTGIGISKEYLGSHLFTAFSQEDPLAPGTGLGMSIVQNILRYLGGNIKVKSQLGTGTIAEISIPLNSSIGERDKSHMITQEPSVQATLDIVQSLKRDFKEKTVSFIPFEDDSAVSSASTIKKYLTDWYGIQIEPWTLESHPDLILMDETQLSRMHSAPLSKVLILCRRVKPLQATIQHLEPLCESVEWLCLPCGPHKLARAIHRCLQGGAQPKLQQISEKTASNSTRISNQTNVPTAPIGTAKPSLQSPSHLSSNPTPSSSFPTPQSTQITQPTTQPESGKKLSLDNKTVEDNVGFEGLRILIVEDNPINMGLLQKLVKKCSSICHTAVDGQKAVDAVNKFPEGYHIIFMDLSMPVMDGFEATEAIRALETERPSIPSARIVALTGLGSDEHVTKAYASGVDMFVTKPVSFKEITRIINDVKTQAPWTNKKLLQSG